MNNYGLRRQLESLAKVGYAGSHKKRRNQKVPRSFRAAPAFGARSSSVSKRKNPRTRLGGNASPANQGGSSSRRKARAAKTAIKRRAYDTLSRRSRGAVPPRTPSKKRKRPWA